MYVLHLYISSTLFRFIKNVKVVVISGLRKSGPCNRPLFPLLRAILKKNLATFAIGKT